MMKKFSRSRVFGLVLCGLVGSALAQSCSSSSNDSGPADVSGSGGMIGPDANNDTVVTPPSNGGDGGESPYNPLCGIARCVPDDPNACPPTNAGTGGSA